MKYMTVECQLSNNKLYLLCTVVYYVGSEQPSGHGVFLSELSKDSRCSLVAEYFPSVREAPGKEKKKKESCERNGSKNSKKDARVGCR